ncbi:MAG: helix-turn-helix domain-containing protein [Acidovorax sp.]|uniref:helix-turn-helix domain-containing protein n=1 Tax=Acidovorax sp. TaxID=1872122 RepID=UPI00391C13F8
MPVPQREKPKLAVSARKLIAVNVLRLRNARGWSQEDLAWDAGIHRNFVAQLEREGRNATVDNLEALAAALKVDIRELFAPVIESP